MIKIIVTDQMSFSALIQNDNAKQINQPFIVGVPFCPFRRCRGELSSAAC